MELTRTEENYLKAIYHLENLDLKAASTNAIAEKMQTKASSVTDMIKKLADKNLANYIRYKGVTLTKKGKNTAINIVRKHRLWEVFLVDKLNFSWDEVHEVAEQLEHIKSKKLIKQLDVFLGNPTQDPHGDPIPDAQGNIPPFDKVILSQLQANDHCTLVGVKHSKAEFLKYLDKNELTIGKKITVISKEPFDESMKIKVNVKTLQISKLISQNLFVKLN